MRRTESFKMLEVFGSSIKGFIKVQRGHASCMKTTAANYMTAVEQLWEDMAVYQTELIARPEFISA